MVQKLLMSLDWFENILVFIGGILISIATFSVVLEVITRFLFNHSFVWVNEFVEYVLLYVPFLGAAWLLRKNAHITIDVLEIYFSNKMRRIADMIIILIGLFVSAVLFWYGKDIFLKYLESDLRSLTPMKVPLAYVMICIPIGSLVLFLEFIRKGFLFLKGARE